MEIRRTIVPVNIEDEMKRSYMDYAMSVIIRRALPDARDGLKPVHRRVLYAMFDQGNEWNRPYRKSARVVGDVIGKYHPHGDAAVYDTIVRMAQDFSLRCRLVDGQGNFGSIDGDSPAAMRYTEVRLQRLAGELLEDIDKETVEFVPNYDESFTEPSVLPAGFPNLLVNGTDGIAVGMATRMPTHNLNEVIDGLITLIENPDLELDNLMNYIPGPDFPLGGIICGRQGIRNAYRTGKGSIQIRAHVQKEINERTNRESLIVSDIPYQVNKARLVERIAELIRSKKVEGISDLRDESDQDIRVVIELKRDAISEVILNQLFKHTNLQISYGINMLALENGRPRLFNLKGLLQSFIEHRKIIVTRKCAFDLRKAEERAHILEGLKVALDHLDEVIAMIRGAATPAEARTGLMEAFDLSNEQARAILDMRLQRLTGIERDNITEEYNDLLHTIAQLTEILSNERMILNLIVEDLTRIKSAYGDTRRTVIIDAVDEIDIEDLIVEEDMVVTVSHTGYIKRNPVSLYRSQHRGGKGITGMGTKTDDFVENLFIASTHDYILFFSDLGRVYWLKVHEVPQASRAARGKAIVNLLRLDPSEKITAHLKVREFDPEQYIMMATRRGIVKKTELRAFSNPRRGGIIAINLDEKDKLIDTRITDGSRDIFLASRSGKSIRFKEQEVRPMGRPSRGVKGMDLEADDWLVGMVVIDEGADILTVTENGFGKRTPASEYRLQGRGGKGIITIKTSDRNGKVVGIRQATAEDDLMLITDQGTIIRIKVKGVSVIGRNTQGVKLIGLSEGEQVGSITRVVEKDEEEIEEEVKGEGEE